MTNKVLKPRPKVESKVERYRNFEKRMLEPAASANMPPPPNSNEQEFEANITNSPIVTFFKTYNLDKLEELPHILNKLKHLIPPFKSEEMVKNYSKIRKNLFEIKKKDEKFILNQPTPELIMPFISMNRFISDTEEQLNKVGLDNKEFQSRLSEMIQSINKSDPPEDTIKLVKDYYSKYDAISDKELTLENDQNDILVLLWISHYETAVWRKSIENLPFPKSSRKNLDLSPQSDNSPPTPPPSRSTSGVNSSDSLSKDSLSKETKLAELQSLLPKNDKVQENSFLRGYDIKRLYAFYGIYYKLCKPKEDPWERYNATVQELTTMKQELTGKTLTEEDIGKISLPVQAIEETLSKFGTELIKFDEMISYKEEPDDVKKVFHYSRFNRIFQNNYLAKGEGIASLIHVYHYELKLWKQAINPPEKEVHEEVAQGDAGKRKAVESFFERFDQVTEVIPEVEDTRGVLVQGFDQFFEGKKVKEKDKIKIKVGEEEDIPVFISILEKIAIDDKLIAKNSRGDFTEEIKNNLKASLEKNIEDIKSVKKLKTTDQQFDRLREILESTTKNINQVEIFLDGRKKLLNNVEPRTILKDIATDDKNISNYNRQKYYKNVSTLFTRQTMTYPIVAAILGVVFSSVTAGAAAAFLLLVYVAVVATSNAIKPTNSFSTKRGFIARMYILIMKRIYKSNDWGEYDPIHEIDWRSTIEKIDYIKTPYQLLWVVMLYSKKRAIWDHITSDFLEKDISKRGTFMDKVPGGIQRLGSWFSKFSLPKLSFKWSTVKNATVKNATVKNATVKNATVKNATVKNANGSTKSNNQLASLFKGKLEEKKANNTHNSLVKGRLEELKAKKEERRVRVEESNDKEKRLARIEESNAKEKEAKEKERLARFRKLNNLINPKSPNRPTPIKGKATPRKGTGGPIVIPAFSFGGGTRHAKTRRRKYVR